MPKFAKHIEITRRGTRGSPLVIDGQEIPWHLGPEITVPAERITSDDDLNACADAPTTSAPKIGEFFGTAPQPRDPTGPLARAEAARDQAEELLANAHQALEDNHATIDLLRADLAEAREAPPQDSSLDAAKLSLKEAERWEAQADDDPDALVGPRKRMRDELLLANVQASIAVVEALAAAPAPVPTFGDAVTATQADIEDIATELLASLNEANRIQRQQSTNLERFCRLLEDS